MVTALLIITRGAHIAASILTAGIFTFYLVTFGLARPSVSSDSHEIERRLFWLALWSLIAALLSALVWFWLEVANMSGLSLTDAFSTPAWRAVLFETGFGRVWQIRFVLVTITFVLTALGLVRDKVRRALVVIVWLLSIAFLVSLAWISHAASASVQPLGLLGDALHLCAAGGWIGGLVPLAIFLIRARASLSLGQRAPLVLQRFSTLSLTCVGVLIVSGISNSWLLVGSIHALLTTRYGWLLLAKLAAFGVLVGVGARNRFIIRARLPRVPTGPDLLAQLSRNVICETCLGLAVVAIVACLGVTPPARGM
jgi:putative copper resistance protein D